MNKTYSVARAIVIHDGKILLLRNQYADGEFWGFPGGTQDPSETLEECAVREVKEETYLDVKLVKPLYVHEFIKERETNNWKHCVTMYFLAEPVGDVAAVTHEHDPDLEDEKIQEVAWFPVEELTSRPMRPGEFVDVIIKGCEEGFPDGLQKLPTTRRYCLEENLVVHERIRSLLEENGFEYKLLEHEFVHSSADAAKVRGTKLEEAAKALVLKDRVHDEFFMCVLSGHERLDLKKIKSLRASKNVSLAKPEEVLAVTGCKVGTVPPFPVLFNVQGFADEGLFSRDHVVFSAASHYKSIRMKSVEWGVVAGVERASLARSDQ